MMKKVVLVAAAIALLGLGIAASADVFNLGTGFTNLETVTVGDPGNAADTRYATPGYGSVGYTYNIGKYEVTNAQYADFLNHKAKSDPYGLYAGAIQRVGVDGSYTYSVADDWANRPVNYVSYWDACRFANWLHNGQGDGDTETGAYTLNGYNGVDGRTIKRNADCKWAVTSEDEWYKAAYYDPNKGGTGIGGYWDYPTQSDTVPSNLGSDSYTDPGNNANYYNWMNGYTIGSPYWRTNVGEFENSASAYGTFDQGGNVWEWNEAIVAVVDTAYWVAAYRGERGGAFDSGSRLGDLGLGQRYLRASTRYYYESGIPNPGVPGSSASSFIGFRVVQAVPEPSSMIALLGGLGSLLTFRRRRA